MKVFILVFALLMSFICLWYGIKLIRLWLKVKRWEKITATITQKSVVKKTLSSASRAAYKLSIDYSYLYNLQKYNGNKIFLVDLLKGEKGFLYKAGEKFLEKIKPEEEIYVNPNNPEESVMYCDGIALYIFVLFMSLMSLLIGLANYYS